MQNVNMSRGFITRETLTVISITLLIVALVIFVASIQLWNRGVDVSQGISVNEQQKIVTFMDNFVTLVLASDSEVSFDDRLKLENDVRELANEDVLAAWQRFVNSGTDREAQDSVVELLGILIAELSTVETQVE